MQDVPLCCFYKKKKTSAALLLQKNNIFYKALWKNRKLEKWWLCQHCVLSNFKGKICSTNACKRGSGSGSPFQVWIETYDQFMGILRAIYGETFSVLMLSLMIYVCGFQCNDVVVYLFFKLVDWSCVLNLWGFFLYGTI